MRKGLAQLSRQIKQVQKQKQKDCTGTDTNLRLRPVAVEISNALSSSSNLSPP